MTFSIRAATLEDIPLLEALIGASVRGLRADLYTEQQAEVALQTVFGVDRQLIGDGTYFVAEVEGKIVACGGWSRRKTLYGSDHAAGRNDAWLDPAVDPARVRAFFVHPDWTRRGIGSGILKHCESAAAKMGFTRLELASTLPGEPLYRAHGFVAVEPFEVPLRDGLALPVIRMVKDIAPQPAGPR